MVGGRGFGLSGVELLWCVLPDTVVPVLISTRRRAGEMTEDV